MPSQKSTSLDWIDEELAILEQADLRRRLSTRTGVQSARVVIDGVSLVHFGSNDYLGLAADPRLAQAVIAATQRDGWGSGASPLITGHGERHRQLEQQLADFEGTEAALLFTSGFAANAGTIAALVGPGDVVYSDRKNHASLWDGCRLSRADVRVYHHNDVQHLESLLTKAADHSAQSKRRLIVTDTLFSMDGDLAPLEELVELAERFDAMLMVDEAHATGVFGRHGRGVAEHLGVEDRVPIRIGTLSKALGSIGGFVVGRRKLIEWLVNRARPYIFSTATPAPVAAAAMAALDIVRDEPQRREQLLAQASALRDTLRRLGWNVGNSASQIIPVMVGEPGRAVELAQQLRDQGFFVPAIRPPTVPDGEACLRISLTSGHTTEMLNGLVESLGRGTA
jgi:8-amino-7-oxononanoate synthase